MARLFDWLNDPQRQAKIIGARLNAELDNLFGVVREQLTSATTFFVSTTGSDSNDGRTVSTPFLTGQFAADYIANNIDTAGQVVTLKFADGNYGTITFNPLTTSEHPNHFIIEGNTATPANVTMSAWVRWTCRAHFKGITFTFDGGSFVQLTAGEHVEVEIGSNCVFAVNASFIQIYIYDYGRVFTKAPFTISGSSPRSIRVQNYASFSNDEDHTITLSGTPAFSTAFAYASDYASIDFSTCTFSGAATGTRSIKLLQGEILSANQIPGDAQGIAVQRWECTASPLTKTGDFTVGALESSFICNGGASITVTLPSATLLNVGRWITIKTIAAQTVVSVSSNVVPLVGGAAGTAILAATAGKWADLQSDGTDWIIMRGN